jgi:hypothetical protein
LDEIANDEVNLKDLKTGNQEKLKRSLQIEVLQQRLLAGS